MRKLSFGYHCSCEECSLIERHATTIADNPSILSNLGYLINRMSKLRIARLLYDAQEIDIVWLVTIDSEVKISWKIPLTTDSKRIIIIINHLFLIVPVWECIQSKIKIFWTHLDIHDSERPNRDSLIPFTTKCSTSNAR